MSDFKSKSELVRVLSERGFVHQCTDLEALDAAAATLELTREAYRAGRASLLQLLDAQRQYQQARLGRARALGQRFTDSAQWFIAMGAPADADLDARSPGTRAP